MSTIADSTRPDATLAGSTVSSILDGYVGAHVLHALTLTGVFDELHGLDTPVHIGQLAGAVRGRDHVLRGLLRAAASLGLVRYDDVAETVELTADGREAYRVRGYVTVSVGGFGEVFRQMDSLVAGDGELGVSVRQDHRLTALGCAQNWAFQRPIFDAAVASLTFRKVADLGCGAAVRLIHLVRSSPGAVGVGVDASPEVCRVARQNVEQAGLGDRIEIVCADVREVVTSPHRYPTVVDADLVTTYFLLHHFIRTRVEGRPFLSALRAAFTNVGHLVVADGFRAEAPAGTGPLFTLGFQLFHEAIGVDLPSLPFQRSMFDRCGLRVVRQNPFGHPLEWLFVLAPAGPRDTL